MKILDHRIYYVAFLIFGLGAWIIPNCLFIEVSALYTRTPEMMSISSYILFAIQAANLILIPYMIYNQNQQYMLLSTVIWCLLLIGFIDGVLFSFFWDTTTLVFGRERSIILLLLSFAAGMVGSIANIVFFPFAATYPSFCTTMLSTGLGLSGVVAGIFGLLQDSGGIVLRFSVSVFFLLGAAVFISSSAAFLFLLYHPLMSSPNLQIPGDFVRYKRMVEKGIEKDMIYETAPLLTLSTPRRRRGSSVLVEPHEVFHKSRHMIIPLIVQGWVACMNYGILVSIIPFVGIQYKSGSEVMKWASVMSMSCDPIGRMLTGWVRFSWRSTLCNVAICTFIVLLFVAIAAKMINPPFASYELGGIYVVIGNSMVTFLSSYSTTMIYLILKARINTYHQALHCYPICPEINEEIMTQTAYQRAGVAMEVGASLGTIISFSAIQYYS